MADIWGQVGLSDTKRLGENWLYRKKGQLHGPVSKDAVVRLLLDGELGLDDEVAREGGSDFHPVHRVKTFLPYMRQIQSAIDKRRAKSRRKTRAVLALVGLLVLGGAGGWMYLEFDKIQKAQAEEQAKLQAEKEGEKRKREKALETEVATLSLVDFKAADVDIQKSGDAGSGSKKSSKNGRKRGGKRTQLQRSASGQGPAIGSCQRDKQQVFSILAKHKAKLAVCIRDQKARPEGIPDTLQFNYVIRATGEVVNFGILSPREYRSGPLRNCMTKAFSAIRYPPAGGSSCPIQQSLNLK